MKTGVFRQVMDLKIQRKNLGGAFRLAQLSRGRWAVPLNLPLRGQITCNLLLEIFAQNLFVLQLLPRWGYAVRLWNRGRVLPIIESVTVTRMARPTDLRGLFKPRYRPKERQITLQSSRLPQVKTNSTCPIHSTKQSKSRIRTEFSNLPSKLSASADFQWATVASRLSTHPFKYASR
jgi:hypothetical protein